jgi:hypothetical protein
MRNIPAPSAGSRRWRVPQWQSRRHGFLGGLAAGRDQASHCFDRNQPVAPTRSDSRQLAAID